MNKLGNFQLCDFKNVSPKNHGQLLVLFLVPDLQFLCKLICLWTKKPNLLISWGNSYCSPPPPSFVSFHEVVCTTHSACHSSLHSKMSLNFEWIHKFHSTWIAEKINYNWRKSLVYWTPTQINIFCIYNLNFSAIGCTVDSGGITIYTIILKKIASCIGPQQS